MSVFNLLSNNGVSQSLRSSLQFPKGFQIHLMPKIPEKARITLWGSPMRPCSFGPEGLTEKRSILCASQSRLPAHSLQQFLQFQHSEEWLQTACRHDSVTIGKFKTTENQRGRVEGQLLILWRQPNEIVPLYNMLANPLGEVVPRVCLVCAG